MIKYLIILFSISYFFGYAQTQINTANSNSVANINTAIKGSITATGIDAYAATMTGFTWGSGEAMDITFVNGNTTGPYTFSLNGGSALTFKKVSSGSLVNLVAGDISPNQRLRFYHNGTYLVLQSGGGSGGGSGVTSVSGTANQIASTGGTTPVLSIVTNPILPGSPTIASPGNSTQNIVTTDATQTLSNKTLVAPALGTPASGVGTNITGIVGTNVTNTPAGNISATTSQAAINELDTEKQSAITFGTGVQTALGVNIGSAGAPVLFNGAGGAPSSMTGTNIIGIPISTGISGSYANLQSVLTGTSPWITTSGTSTLVGATAIASNTIGQLNINGTTTTTANSQEHLVYNPSITLRNTSSDLAYGVVLKPTLTAGASGQVLYAVDIRPSFVSGAFSPVRVGFRISDGSGNGYFHAYEQQQIGIGLGNTAVSSSTTLTIDRGTSAVNSSIIDLKSSGSSLWKIGALGNVTQAASNSTTLGSTDMYTLGGTYSAASGNPQSTGMALKPTINYTGTVSGAIVVGYDFTPIQTSITGTQIYSFRGTAGAAVFGKAAVDASTTRLQITGTGTGTGYNLFTQNLSNTSVFGARDDGKIFFFQSPSNDDTETKYLVWDAAGEIQYKNESAIGAGSFWKNVGTTTGISAALSGAATFAGTWGQTTTMTDVSQARPVNNAMTFQVQPTSAPAMTIDYHGIDYSMSSSGNTNSDTNLYPNEMTVGHDGTGTVGGLYGLFINNRNTSTGTVGSMTGIRLRMRNNNAGGTVGTYYGIRMNQPILTGSLSDWYGMYIEDISGPTTNTWGLYSLEQNNYTAGIKVGGTPAVALSTVDVAGSLGAAITTVTTNTTLDATHYTVLCDATSGNITITLPTASTATRRTYVIKKIDSSGNTVAFTTADGSITLSAQWAGKQIQSNGTSYYITASF